jgi:Melibiase
MNPILGNDAVEVDCASGSWTIRWPAVDVTLGACHAATTLDGSDRDSGPRGTWQTEPDGAGGSVASWHATTGPTVTVRVAAEGPVVVIDTAVRVAAATVVDRISPLIGATDLRYDRRLVDGYDSWAYSGVRGPEPGASFWNAALVGDDDRTLALQALDARRLCTRITTEGASVRVDCGASPPLIAASGTWGYRVGQPPPLRLGLNAGQTLSGPSVALLAGSDPLEAVETLAMLAAAEMDARHWSGPPVHGWESWYHYGLSVSAADVMANASALRARYGDRPHFDLVQIDDGWQRAYGAWWPNERFPSDLGELVHTLRSFGCRPGLWVAPFRVQPGAPGLATEHPDWCLHDPSGAPLLERRSGSWGLDASHPEALGWVRDLGGQIRDWGFEMVKVDFCYLAALEARRYDKRRTGIEALRQGLGALVDGLGDQVYVLGCGMPMLPAVGLCHANRVGHDLAMPRAHQVFGHPLDEGWTGFAGVRAQARNVAARWAQTDRWYDVDPEVVMAWGSDGADPAGFGTEEAQTLATMVAMCGGPFLLADDLTRLRPVERAVLEQPALLDLVDRLGGASFRPVDLFQHPDGVTIPEHAFAQGPSGARCWIAQRGSMTVAALFNWDDQTTHRLVPADLVGSRELWTGARVEEQLVVPPHGVRVLINGEVDVA